MSIYDSSDEITHVDPIAQQPLPARLTSSYARIRPRYFLLSRSTLIGAVLGLAALVCLRGCA